MRHNYWRRCYSLDIRISDKLFQRGHSASNPTPKDLVPGALACSHVVSAAASFQLFLSLSRFIIPNAWRYFAIRFSTHLGAIVFRNDAGSKDLHLLDIRGSQSQQHRLADFDSNVDLFAVVDVALANKQM